ncbi:MAG TPA: SMP-30/gluconolactonase/LRE family protein [Clostridia bacterium]|nr:SMP-30/gluconolactonase/LRE family protein [Clostridia bacterium]
MTRVECVHSGICHLGEGPVWNVQRQRLYWTDIYGRRIWEHNPAEGLSRIFWEGSLQVGGFAFTKSGGMVLCSDKGVYLLEEAETENEGKRLKLLFDFSFTENEMFNDITVDPEGRIFAGTISRPDFTGGVLYRLEKGRMPVAVLKDLHCSNGMTFSLDGKYFYHTDSTFQTIMKYEYDRSTGEIGNPSLFFKGSPEMGSPDGMTMDSEGCIWSAFWGDSCVRRLDPAGRVIEKIEVPAEQPSSVMFGGKELKELYITSACENADDIVTGFCKDGVFLGGPVYRCVPGVTGRAEWLADF